VQRNFIRSFDHDTYVMSDNLHELKTAFQGLQTLYQTYLPKVDPFLIHDLLIRQQQDPRVTPIYMVEVFTKPGTDSQALRERIWNATGMMPAIYDKGTHYVTNHKLTLDMLKRISDTEEVIEVSGDYTGSITGLGASRDIRGYSHISPSAALAPSSGQQQQQEQTQESSSRVNEQKSVGEQEEYKKRKKGTIVNYKPLVYVLAGVAAAIAISGFFISGGNLPNINQSPDTSTTPSVGPTGALHGYVGGPTGLPAIGASVIAANQETGFTENAIISLNGQYFLGNLPEGQYIVMVAFPDGTNKAVNEFQIESGSNNELNFSY
jgi:hypothetical protein